MIIGCRELLAYIDPATGALVLQIVLAAVLGFGLLLRRHLIAPFAHLFALLRGHKRAPVDKGASEE